MARRIGIHLRVRVGVQNPSTQPHSAVVRDVGIICDEAEMRLLRHILSWPLGSSVSVHSLERQADRAVGIRQLGEEVVGGWLRVRWPAEKPRVELRQSERIGAIEGDGGDSKLAHGWIVDLLGLECGNDPSATPISIRAICDVADPLRLSSGARATVT